MHLLIIEDDLDLGLAVQQALRTEGISSAWVRRGADALLALSDATFDCVLLDLGLPDGDGLGLLRRWRQQGERTPIVVITARAGLDDRLAGLDGGADDVLVKPFAMPELVSRVRAVTRRTAQQASDVWLIGPLHIEPRARVARLDGVALELPPREFNLLVELARERGQVVPKSRLAQRLAPLGDPVEHSTLEVHLSNLRRKIGPELIRTVRGVGYALDA